MTLINLEQESSVDRFSITTLMVSMVEHNTNKKIKAISDYHCWCRHRTMRMKKVPYFYHPRLHNQQRKDLYKLGINGF